jgi:hypothetical protein
MLRTSNTTDPTVYTEQSVTIVVSPETELPTAIIVQGTDLLVTAGSQSSTTAQANSGNVTYSWSEIGTSYLNFLTPVNSQTVLFDVPVATNTSLLRLTVTDTDVNTVSTADINVTASIFSASAPVANVTDDTVDGVVAYGGVLTLSSSTSNDDEGVTSQTWTDINGNFTGTSEQGDLIISPVPSEDIDYLFNLEVRDEANNSNSTTHRISVRSATTGNVPVVNASGSSYSVGDINLDGTGTFDPEKSTTLTYAWTATDVPVATDIGTVEALIDDATLLVTSLTPSESGSYTFRLTATDDETGANFAFDEVTILIP